MINKFITLLLVCICHLANAQDSLVTLNAEQLLQLVKKYHPIAKQTQIGVEKSEAEITLARGAFNPIIGNYMAQKTFGGTNYYNYVNPQVKLPTW